MILVTGGAGFIGSVLLAALDARGLPDLVCCDRLGSGDKWQNIAKRRLADVIRPDRLFGWLDRHAGEVEAVFHLGALSSTDERDADLIVQENIRTTLDLVDWCASHRTRLVYASSAATYGDGEAGFDDDPLRFSELRPRNAYGWSKLMVDRRIVDLAGRGQKLPPQWAGLKFFNVYGPNEWHKGGQQSVVPQFLKQIQETGVCRLFRSHRQGVADGDQRRDFVWVDDVVQVMMWLYDHPDRSGIFNVGSGRARSFLELAYAVFQAVGREPAIEFVDMPERLRQHYQYFTEARLDRLRAAGCPLQPTPLEEGVRRYVQDSLLRADPYR
ncbi:ADP-glyceromanno-heptose 6-epimerase [Geminicoccus flavidas]|uniref:ADP-glyceromanno-heptose 6-epimerase n=1 Tax=Geminicoccus flavidas TaxID=2506407 RepID=UPI00135B3CB0|nr:ADP-glyceromanno-heptose 6-epimerase [Geminicoccus flavidas]